MVEIEAFSIFDLDRSSVRIAWLHDLLDYLEERGTPMKFCPSILETGEGDVRKPIDLWELFKNVTTVMKERDEKSKILDQLFRSEKRKDEKTSSVGPL